MVSSGSGEKKLSGCQISSPLADETRLKDKNPARKGICQQFRLDAFREITSLNLLGVDFAFIFGIGSFML
jgi:hypothetical protein